MNHHASPIFLRKMFFVTYVGMVVLRSIVAINATQDDVRACFSNNCNFHHSRCLGSTTTTCAHYLHEWEHDPISITRDAPIHSFVFVFSSIQIRFLRVKLEEEGTTVSGSFHGGIVTTTEKNALKERIIVIQSNQSIKFHN